MLIILLGITFRSPSFSSIFLPHTQTRALRRHLGLLATLSEAPSISSLKMVQHLKRPGSKLSELSRVPWIGATMPYLPSPRFPTLALISVMTIVIRPGLRSQPTLIRSVSLHLPINRATAACPTDQGWDWPHVGWWRRSSCRSGA